MRGYQNFLKSWEPETSNFDMQSIRYLYTVTVQSDTFLSLSIDCSCLGDFTNLLILPRTMIAIFNRQCGVLFPPFAAKKNGWVCIVAIVIYNLDLIGGFFTFGSVWLSHYSLQSWGKKVLEHFVLTMVLIVTALVTPYPPVQC